MTRQTEETAEHRRLKDAIREIARACGFIFDSEIALNLSGLREADGEYINEISVDVAAYGKYKSKSFLFIFECKGGKNLNEVNREISSWESNIRKINGNKARVISSDENKIKDNDFRNVKEIKVCYVFGSGFDQVKFERYRTILKRRSFHAWDNAALSYFKKVASTVAKWLKYEIWKEFDINFERETTWVEKAVEIKQGDSEMYFLGVRPSVLLKIGYVSRRASGRPAAYQRILNKERIGRISKFVTSKDALLPNAIIIAFDEQPEVQRQIVFEEGYLNFPNIYCSAWIIDGQHRVFGFLGTKFENVDQDDRDDEFKLPVVAFRSLDSVVQNRTFVSINYNQKKIDPTLLCDLATSVPDLQNELTWPSLLIAELNKSEPLKDKVKISELHTGRPISLSSFARYGLLEGLLGYDKNNQQYRGPLNAYCPFNSKALLKNETNQNALKKQSTLLKRYFNGVANNTRNDERIKDPWSNNRDYSLLKPAGINALLLVLSRIMEKHPKAELDFEDYLEPLSTVNFKRNFVAKQGGGWKGFRGLANVMLRKLNRKHRKEPLRLFGGKEKT